MKQFFYKPVKETGKDENFLFWCCMHSGHDPKWEIPLWKRRGYNSAEEHTVGILNAWNRKANKDTVGFLLGDNIFGDGAEDRLKDLLEKMEFNRLYIMSGNHCAGWKQIFEGCGNGNIYETKNHKEVVFVPNYLEAYVNKQPIVMCHYPILSWNGMADGSWMLFGHVHGSLTNSELGRMYLEKAGKVLEVSVEVAPEPLTFGEIRTIMKTKGVKEIDHHVKGIQNPF
jgi:calcineurin-like phosphoesterase family protein